MNTLLRAILSLDREPLDVRLGTVQPRSEATLNLPPWVTDGGLVASSSTPKAAPSFPRPTWKCGREASSWSPCRSTTTGSPRTFPTR